MASERIKLFEADIDTDGIIKKSVELKQEMYQLRLEQQKLKLTVGETSEEYIKTEARLKKVSAEYTINQRQVTNLSTSSKDFLGITQKLVTAIDREVLSIVNAKDNNAELRKVRDQLNATTDDGAAAIAEINKKIDQNTAFIKSNVSELEVQKINIGDYKNQIKDAYSELNIFNGGIGGFIQRAQQAGGVSQLLTKSTKSLATGIGGITKASLTFLATPIGIVLAGIGLILGALVKYLSSTQEGIDAVTSVTRPLLAVFETLIGVVQDVGKFLFEAFSNPKKTLTELYEFVKGQLTRSFESFGKILEGIATLNFSKIKDGFSDLGSQATENIGKVVGAAAGLRDRLDEAYDRGVRIDGLMKQLAKGEADFITNQAQLKENLKQQNLIAEDQTKTLKERETAAAKSIEIAKDINVLQRERLGIELELLDLNSKNNATSDSQKAEIASKIAEINASNAQALELETTQQNKLNSIRKQAQSEALAAGKKAVDEALKLQEIELQTFIESQGTKAKTLQQGLDIAKQVAEKRIKILDAELKAGIKSQQEYSLEILKINNELVQKQAELTTDLAQRELDAYIQKNQSKIDSDLYFSDESLKIEQERLNGIAEQQKEFARIQLEKGVISATDYNDALNTVNEDNRLALLEAQNLRDEAKKEKDIIDLENKRMIDEELNANDFALKSERLEAQRLKEVEEAGKTDADIKLINEKYAAFRKNLDNDINDFKVQRNAETFAAISDLLGKESLVGKAVALAAIINDTATKALQAFNTASVLASNPFTASLAPNAYLQAGLIVAKGAAQAAKIVVPKLERGGVIDIGGNRHSQGGTTFQGTDGTRFEAERGEKMFILNRNASAALAPLLSSINQKYGGASLDNSYNYLAGGGQVLRSQNTSNITDLGLMTKEFKAAMIEASIIGTEIGSSRGTERGSARGTYTGIVDREDYIAVAKGANF